MIGFKKVPTKLVLFVFISLVVLILLLYLDLSTDQPPPEEEILFTEEVKASPEAVQTQKTHTVKEFIELACDAADLKYKWIENGNELDTKLCVYSDTGDKVALEISEISNAFQESVLDVLMTKSVQVANQFNCETILVSGGVAANGYLRSNFENNNDINAIFPERKYCTDNGIMIACRGLIDFRNKSFRSPESIKVNPQLNIT